MTDRAELAKVYDAHAWDRTHLRGAVCCCGWEGRDHDDHRIDVLAAHVRAKQAEAVEEVGRLIDESGVRTDSAERWGIITALHIVRDRADWLRDGT